MKRNIGFLGVTLLMFLVLGLAAATAQVTGSGTKGNIAVWTSNSSIGNSKMKQSNGGVTVSNNGTALSGTNSAVAGSAIFGHATVTSGNTSSGVLGQADSSGGASGVVGHSTATTGSGNGVFGQTDSPGGAGVFGYSTSTTGSSAGGVFIGNSSTGAALVSINNSSSGSGATGIYAQSTAPGASAIVGHASAKSGVFGAVVGLNDSDDPGGGSALSGFSTTTTGTVQGIYAETNSSDAVVAQFRNNAHGNIILGQVASNWNVFRVDGTGKGFFDGGTQTGGADFAEAVAAREHGYQPGDLLIVDTATNRQLKLSDEPYSTLVAGIYSTKPGVLATQHSMNDTGFADEIPLAIVGIVPCKVSAENGPIQRGDLLVTSSTPGFAMKGTDRSKMLGTVVGKALEPLEKSSGVIQVLVTLQ